MTYSVKDGSGDRLKSYYKALYKKMGRTMPDSVNYIIDTMGSSDQDALAAKIEKKDPFFDRMSAYYMLLKEHSQNAGMVAEQGHAYNVIDGGKNENDSLAANEPTTDEFYEPMDDIAKAEEQYDYSKDHIIELNGNKFTYSDGFPIDEYKNVLISMGDKEKGNAWDVSLKEGKLVIY